MKEDQARLLDILENLGRDLRAAFGYETDHIGLRSAEREIEKGKRLVMKIAREREVALGRIAKAKAVLAGRVSA